MDKNAAKRHFGRHADEWLRESYQGDGYDYPTAHHRVRIVCKILADRDAPLTVADLGCGGGNLAITLAAKGHRVTGVDQTAKMIEIANAAKSTLPPEAQDNVAFIEAPIESSGLPAASFDAVIAMGVIGYQENDDGLFETAASLLKPQGLFLVSCRNRLFNMASPSFRTFNEIEAGTAPALIHEADEFCRPVPAADARAFVARIKAEAEAAAQAADTLGTTETGRAADERPHIEARQHTPKELEKTADSHGFDVETIYGVHPHLIDPRVNRLLPPGVFNTISTSLEALEHLPVSLLWSSAFISVCEKRA